MNCRARLCEFGRAPVGKVPVSGLDAGAAFPIGFASTVSITHGFAPSLDGELAAVGTKITRLRRFR